jgi:hypothetical protein
MNNNSTLKTWILASSLIICSASLGYMLKTSIDRLLCKQDELVKEVRSLKDFAIEIRLNYEHTVKRVDNIEIRVNEIEHKIN